MRRSALYLTLLLAAPVTAIQSAAQAQANNNPATALRPAPNNPEVAVQQALLRSITLTPSERQQLTAFRKERYAAFVRDEAEVARSRNTAMHVARATGDSTEIRRIASVNRAAVEDRLNEDIAAIQSFLSANQRVQFDANVAKFRQYVAEMDTKGERLLHSGGR